METAIFVVNLLGVVMLETSARSLFSSVLIVPPLVLGISLCWMFLGYRRRSFWWIFVGSIVIDIMTSRHVGLMPLALLVAWWVTSMLLDRIFREAKTPLYLLCLAIATLVAYALVILFALLLGSIGRMTISWSDILAILTGIPLALVVQVALHFMCMPVVRLYQRYFAWSRTRLSKQQSSL